MSHSLFVNRRDFVKTLLASCSAISFATPAWSLTPSSLIKKTIPKTGEQIPSLGMGSWITFNVGPDTQLRLDRTKVLKAFFDAGGGLVDSSPMYGSSEEVIGHCLEQLAFPKGLFSATKVWTPLKSRGISQMENSMKLWGIKRFDLLQIHNLVDWKTHLATLKDMKEKGLVRYIGITTSHGRRHGEFAQIMKTQDIDFVQFTYNIDDREAENQLLPIAQDKGLAVIINRPFQRGSLIDRFAAHPLPEWASQIGCKTWPQFLLKFIISHPAVTCAIPATSQVSHMQENMAAALGPLPDENMRARMITYCNSL